MSETYVIGAGTETRQAISILVASNPTRDIALLVERGFGEVGSSFHGYKIRGYTEALDEMTLGRYELLIAISEPRFRARVVNAVKQSRNRWEYLNAISPQAWHREARVGHDVIMFPFANCEIGVSIGNHIFIGSGVTLGTDSVVSDFCSVGAGAVLGAKSYLGCGVFVGDGAVIRRGRRVGAWATITDGAVVHSDVKPGETMVGNPALEIR